MLTLLAVDLDGLRRIDEGAGHETGDHILRWPAGKPIDGDDDVVVLPTRDPDRADALIHHLHRAVPGDPVPVVTGAEERLLSHGSTHDNLEGHAVVENWRTDPGGAHRRPAQSLPHPAGS